MSRRDLLAGGLSLAALLVFAGDVPAGAAEAGWSFTDDRGETVTLDAPPERVVAFAGAAGALWDFGVRSLVGVWGPQRGPGGEPDTEVGSLDLDTVESIGEEFGDFNLEKLAGLRPDLIVTTVYLPGDLRYVPEELHMQVERVAPIVGINLQGVPLPETIARFGELAEALGADLDAPEVVRAREAFERASDALRQAAARKPGLDVLVVAPFPEGLYVTKPSDAWDLKYWTELGVSIVEPGGPDAYFENLSWEEADRYPADLVLVDARANPDEYASRPTWQSLPAVEAGQVGTWRTAAPTSYQEATAILTELAELIARSRADVV